MQEGLANDAISHTLGRLPVSHYLIDLPHHVAPCQNLHKSFKLDEEEAVADATHFFKPFPYLCSFPVPISPSSKLPQKVLNGIDPVTDLIREKMKWEKKKRKILKANQKDTKYIDFKLIDTALSTVGETTILPRGVALLAAHLQSDPDPQFSGGYNWYYSGGNLASLSHLGETYLLSANAVIPGVISLSKVSEKENVLEMDSTLESFILNNPENSNNGSVLEILTEKGRIAVRQKERVHLLKATEENGQIKLETVHSVQSKQTWNEGFTSVALSGHSEGEYCVLSNLGILRMFQLDKSEKSVSNVKIQPGEGVRVSDNWASIHYSDPNLLLLADRCCVHLLDHRCGLEETQLTWCPKSKCERCEEISMCVPSSIKEHVKYIGTNHQAFALDIRAGFTQRWTHMMCNTPYIGFTSALTNSCEMIVMGGQSQRSVSAIINTWEADDNSVSCNLPYTLSSPVEGLESVRAQGNCLESTLVSRCNLSLTGLGHLTRQNDLFVLRSTSVGDVFCQYLQDKRRTHKKLPPVETEIFTKWVSTNGAEPVRVTSVADFGDIFEVINNWSAMPLSWSQSRLNSYDRSDEHWRVSKSYLEDCVDILSAPILSVWELDDEPEWERSSGNTVEKQDAADKVLNWLGKGSELPKPEDSEKLAEPLPILNSENPTEDLELFDITNLNRFSLSHDTAVRIPSPRLSITSTRSDISITPSLKKKKLSQTIVSQSRTLKSQTPKKKFVSGF